MIDNRRDNEPDLSTEPRPAARLLGRGAVAVGTSWAVVGTILLVIFFVRTVPRIDPAECTWLELLFGFPLLSATLCFMCMIPSILCLGGGLGLAKKISIQNVRLAVAGLTVSTIALFLALLWHTVAPGGVLATQIIGLLIAQYPLGVFVYAVLCRQVFRYDEIPHHRYREIFPADSIQQLVVVPCFVPIIAAHVWFRTGGWTVSEIGGIVLVVVLCYILYSATSSGLIRAAGHGTVATEE